MTPAEIDGVLRAELQQEIEDNRRSEYRLIPSAVVAVIVIVVIAVVRLVFFS